MTQDYDAQLARIPNSILEANGVSVTETSLTITDPSAISYEEAEALCAFLGKLDSGCKWWIGDLLNIMEGSYGEKVYQAAEALKLSPQTVMNRMSICTRIPRSRRRPGLSFSIHAEVAALSPEAQTFWLEKAERNQWRRDEIRSAVREITGRLELQSEVVKKALADQAARAEAAEAESGHLPPAGAMETFWACPKCGEVHQCP